MRLTSYVNNSNLPEYILHRFRDMADYWFNFRCRWGCLSLRHSLERTLKLRRWNLAWRH